MKNIINLLCLSLRWKDSNCPFRKDPRTKLMVIPTLIRWKGPQKLEGEKCAKEELVEMMFQEFDD